MVSLVPAIDQDVLGNVEFRKRTPDARLFGATVPARPERFRLYDHQIDARSHPGVAAGARAK